MSGSLTPPIAVRTQAGYIKLLITGAETNGAMSMIETETVPGGGPSYHKHDREDETFYVISGTAEVQIEHRKILCTAGDRVYGPRDIYHTYRNAGNTALKMLIVYTPAGFEQSFIEQAAMLQAGKDQSEISQMLFDRYGLTREQRPPEA